MGRGATGGALSGLLPLDTKHQDFQDIFRSGTVEEDYEVEKEPIARGKFASVRLARHRGTGEVFAAKFVRRRRRAANLEEEARHEIAVLLLGRSSPNIVHMHQVFETRSEYAIILEFGEGGDLQKLLDDRGRLQENTVRDLLRQVLNGLGFLHQNRVAHLDIKPQNLVLMGLTPEEGVKLVDFGLSRVIHRDTELTQIMGTPDYVAPEVINFEPVGLATDMWSIGVLTYVLLSGYTPFGGETDQETFVNITQGEFDFPEEYFRDISEHAKDFISGLLLKSPNHRLTVDQCLAHPWLADIFDPHRLSQLSEADSADSGYSTDLCSGSPPSPGSLPNGFVSDLCQFSIPEDQQMTTPQPLSSYSSKQFRHHHLRRLSEEEVDRGGSMDRKPRQSSAHLSVNVLECMRPQGRPLRRSSLVIPRHVEEYEPRETHISPFSHLDENQNATNNSFTSGWNGYGQAGHSPSSFDRKELMNLVKPWNNLCYGSYSRALNQLNTPTKKGKLRTNLGIRPELSCSMFELKPRTESTKNSKNNNNNNNNNTIFSDKPSSFDLRKSKSELRASRKDIRSQNPDLGNSRSDLRNPMTNDLISRNGEHRKSLADIRGSRIDLRGSKSDLRGSRHELNGSKYDLHNSKPEFRFSKADFSKSKHDKASSNLLSSHNFSSIPYLNMSLSRLDIAHETLNNDESEERDIVNFSDCTLPRRFSRSNVSPLLQGNSFHMSFRRPKKRDNKI